MNGVGRSIGAGALKHLVGCGCLRSGAAARPQLILLERLRAAPSNRALHISRPRLSQQPPPGSQSSNGSAGQRAPPHSTSGGGSAAGEGGGGSAAGPGGADAAASGAGGRREPYRAVQILHQGTILYEDLERLIMKQIRSTNQSRFRIGFITVFVGSVWVLATFGTQIRSFFSRHTAEVAKETLQNEALQIQTRELSAAVVQYILNDPEVLTKASVFLSQAASNPETQRALVDLAKHVFTHPETLAVVVELAQQLVPRVLQSQETLDQVAVLLGKVIVEAPVQAGAVVLIQELIKDPEVYEAVVQLAARVVEEESVQEAVNKMLVGASHKVLEDVEVIEHTKGFVSDVVADDTVQRTGGTAIWNSLQYSFQPRIVKVMWFGLLCGVVAFIRMSAGNEG